VQFLSAGAAKSLFMSKRAVIGIDIGGTKTMAALFNDKFCVIAKRRFKTESGRGDATFERRLRGAVNSLLKTAKVQQREVIATGIGCSGSVDLETMGLQISPHIPFLKDYPLTQKMAEWTKSDVYLGNDVQMGLYGEHQLGAAQGCAHVIGIFIGTGIGGALIINGKLHRGANGIAGDIGHYLVQPLGSVGGRERQGMLDNIASRTAIAGEAAVFASRQWAPHLWKMAGTDIGKIRSKTLARAIEAGDKEIEKLVRSRARIVGIVLSNLIDFINPDAVVLGGGLIEEMGELFLAGVKGGIQEYSTASASKQLKILTTKLKSYAVAMGAAKMALDVYTEKEQSRQDS
jgi:glucokinase